MESCLAPSRAHGPRIVEEGRVDRVEVRVEVQLHELTGVLALVPGVDLATRSAGWNACLYPSALRVEQLSVAGVLYTAALLPLNAAVTNPESKPRGRRSLGAREHQESNGPLLGADPAERVHLPVRLVQLHRRMLLLEPP